MIELEPTAPRADDDPRLRSFAEAVNEALDAAMARDGTVTLIGEDIEDPIGGVMKATTGLSTKYGRSRVRNTPIAEQAIVGTAIGAAMAGMRPVAEIMFMDFLLIGLDQLVNHAAKMRYMSGGQLGIPLTVRTAVSGGRGTGAQHSQSLEAWFMHTPGLKVAVPATPYDAKGLLSACIRDEDPCIHMESLRLLSSRGPVPEADYTIPLGIADIKRAGHDVTIVTWGWQVPVALDAATELASRGISAEVVDMRTLVPLDIDAVLASAARTKRVLIVHAATRFAGPGAEIAATVGGELFGELEVPVERLGGRYAPTPHASVLEAALYPAKDDIVETVVRMEAPSTRR